MKHPFVIYADFESFIKPIDTCAPNTEASYTEKYQLHEPSERVTRCHRDRLCLHFAPPFSRFFNDFLFQI